MTILKERIIRNAIEGIQKANSIKNYPGGEEARKQVIDSMKEKLKSDLNETDLSKYGL